MSSFENTLARMKDLYTYGKELNESNKTSVHTLEHSAKAADGITYGIIRECNKYYIKSAPKGKETVAESYDYLGGICTTNIQVILTLLKILNLKWLQLMKLVILK